MRLLQYSCITLLSFARECAACALSIFGTKTHHFSSSLQPYHLRKNRIIIVAYGSPMRARMRNALNIVGAKFSKPLAEHNVEGFMRLLLLVQKKMNYTRDLLCTRPG